MTELLRVQVLQDTISTTGVEMKQWPPIFSIYVCITVVVHAYHYYNWMGCLLPVISCDIAHSNSREAALEWYDIACRGLGMRRCVTCCVFLMCSGQISAWRFTGVIFNLCMDWRHLPYQLRNSELWNFRHMDLSVSTTQRWPSNYSRP